MNSRIAEVRKKYNLTQEKFAEKICLTRNFVWMIEKGERVPSDRTIADICREFQVDEHWLRTGEGQMQRPMSRNDELARFLGEAIKAPDDFKRTLLTVMSRMPTEEWAMLERKAWELVEEIKKAGPR